MEIMEEILTLYQELRGLFPENDLTATFYQRIHRIVQEMIDRIPDETRVAIRPAGAETKTMLELFDFSKKNVVGLLDQKYCGEEVCGYPCFIMDELPTKAYDRVMIFSFVFRQEIKKDLERRSIPYIDIYDELEKQGIQLSLPCNYYASNFHGIVNYYYLRYLRSAAGPQREAALRDLLQTAVESKDFTLISNIYQACGGENGNFPFLKTVWEKCEHLLDCIRDKIRERKQKDIVLFWTDMVPYNMLHYLPGIMELSKEGASFQRAYAHTPYTNSTLRAMFCNMLPIDDFPESQKKIHSGNSPLLRFMEREGYKVRIIGDSNLVMGAEHMIEAGRMRTSCNIEWWEGMMDLLQSPKPCFYLFHFMESHLPCYVPILIEPNVLDKVPEAQWDAQMKAAWGYLDQCILLYHKLLGNKTQIFFSDHGIHFQELKRWAELKLHSYCFAVGENIPKTTAARFFPYRNFEKFVRWLMDPSQSSLDDICEDEVIFQDIDYYNELFVARCIQNKTVKNGIAYRGILNYNYKYVINAIGEEFFYQRRQDGTEELIPLEDPALRAELRSKAGTEFLDVYQYDKFRYTRKLYDFLKQNAK